MKSHLIACVCLVLPGLGLAQTTGFSGDLSLNNKNSLGSGMLLAPFQYIAPAGSKNANSEPAPKRTPGQKKIVDLNAAGDYRAAGTEGLALMAVEQVDDELQLMVANSLAWTGRIKEAIPSYQALTKGKFANEANIGLANMNRWRGRDDQALPMYQSVLEKDPSNADALEGMNLAYKELSPRTSFGMGGASDSSNSQRRSGLINHRWRDQSGADIFEIEINGVRDWLPAPVPEAKQQEIVGRYQNLDMTLKPSLELSMPTDLNRRLFATGRIKLWDGKISVGAGTVNWSKKASNPNVLNAGLSANYLGFDATQTFSKGRLTGRMDYYTISPDGNSILTSNLTFNPSWRPLGSHFKPFLGVEDRTARFNTSSYWSPAQGAGTAFTGLLGEWSQPDWNLFASAQIGARVRGDSGSSWSVSVGGKRWLTSDVAISTNFWSMASWRDNAAYRSQSLNLNLEKLWH